MLADTYSTRQKISKSQEFEPCTLVREDVEYITALLTSVKAVQKAYLVKRRQERTDLTMHDIVIFPKKYNMLFDANELTAQIESALSELGEATTVFYGPWLDKGVRERLFAVKDGIIVDKLGFEP
ncbi:MAG: hypothetical protein ABIV13_04175 [Fimbriimonadales bacterium]